jgi:hypothetical protein
MDIDRQGDLWPMDRYGRAMNVGDRSSLTPLGRRVARAVADCYRNRLGSCLHSVYLTGPYARGRVGPVRAFGVLRMTASAPSLSWLDEAATIVRARWPGVGRPELALYTWRDVFPAGDDFSPARFQLAVNSVCLVGRDLARLVAPQRLNISAANAWIMPVRERVSAARAQLAYVVREEDIAHDCAEIARFLLTAGFAMVMPHEGVYTEDPDRQGDFIAFNYPERAADAELACRYAFKPTRSAAELGAFLGGFGEWLADQSDIWLDRHNPQRRAALPA